MHFVTAPTTRKTCLEEVDSPRDGDDHEGPYQHG